MQNKKEPIVGLVDTAEGPANFYFENYCATFMSMNKSHTKLDGDFVFGRTIQEQDVAIYKGKNPIILFKTHRLNTAAYIVSTGSMKLTDTSTFDSIEFRGGTLNKVFLCHTLKYVETGSTNRICYDVETDCEHYNFKSGEYIYEAIVESEMTESLGIDGVTISNNNVRFILKFGKPQQLMKVFEHIGKIKDMLAIMTFRKNVGFDEIYIHCSDEIGMSSQVFLREDKRFTETNMMDSISFEDLREVMPQLLSTLYDAKDGAPSYEIGFLPSTDKDVYHIDNNKVRMVCSALACELSFIDDLCPKEETDLQELIKKVKDTVKEHRKGPHKLSSKTYDLIFSSVSNWSRTASDQFCDLYHRYEEEMLILNPSEIDISDDKIRQFVKYRNSITHGSFKVMDRTIATIAYTLSGLVYCAFLSRIGVSREKILCLCKNRQLLR